LLIDECGLKALILDRQHCDGQSGGPDDPNISHHSAIGDQQSVSAM
jgi:hypothetical protein